MLIMGQSWSTILESSLEVVWVWLIKQSQYELAFLFVFLKTELFYWLFLLKISFNLIYPFSQNY